MVITYLDEGCFRLQSGETSLLIDPSGNRLKADVVLRTAVAADDVVSSPDTVSFPGEYEIKGIEIEGFQVDNESTEKMVKTVYTVTWEDIRFVILGGVTDIPDVKVLDRIGEPDVLIVPVEEDHFLTPEAAAKLVKQLAPAVAIPSLWSKKSLAEFSKELGQKSDTEEKFVFRKKDLLPEGIKLVVLGPKS